MYCYLALNLSCGHLFITSESCNFWRFSFIKKLTDTVDFPTDWYKITETNYRNNQYWVIYWNNESAPLTMKFSLQFFFLQLCISKLKNYSSSSWNIFWNISTKSLCKLNMPFSLCKYSTNTCTCKSLHQNAWYSLICSMIEQFWGVFFVFFFI